MSKYNWDLIERLLHEVQNGAGESFKPRKYAEEYAAEKAARSEDVDNLDTLKMKAANYEALLLRNGFIESRPEEEGGNGENFVLTLRGASLLAMIDSSIPGETGSRQRLDEEDDALDPATFEKAASNSQAPGGAI